MKNPLTHISANSVVERIRTNSVLNPLLWLCGIIETTALPAAYFSQGDAKVFFCFLAALPVVSAIVAYFIWMFKEPNRLQSEDYQLAHQRILQGTKEEDEFPTITQTSDHDSKALPYSESDQPDDPPSLIGSLPPCATKSEGT